ncbi:hypothetical protein [Emticicia sp. 21SJ11W-3]|uniref:hypothetical protein n=1 Tax=Emticicia sp. 21SJ11W-3 TaxID=2916755 RepID=UPI00209D7E2E|nr:hypothetical protein [Emticicia sp. 21SJ11W-3]UTA67284.1 hypothetical protein MB380_16975 [Emticicia sp. 21SJ11W-3]
MIYRLISRRRWYNRCVTGQRLDGYIDSPVLPAGKSGKFVIRNAAGGIVGEAMEYVNGVYKKVKKKTSAHNKYLGTFEGEVEFADGTKGKGTYELWGKCGSVSNLRVIANPPKGKKCDNVSEVGAIAGKEGKELYNFGGSAGRHMENPGRAVPIQILDQAIKGSIGVPDPKGSRAKVHSIEMIKDGKTYKLDVLYDKATNTIWHFQYKPVKP